MKKKNVLLFVKRSTGARKWFQEKKSDLGETKHKKQKRFIRDKKSEQTKKKKKKCLFFGSSFVHFFCL
jgi:hypothetical protein